jgi:raffinose/stachyose/melibiose transport system permease protein
MSAADRSMPEIVLDRLDPQTDDRQRRSRRTSRSRKAPRETLLGFLFVLPALAIYVLFVLLPLALTVQYSLYRWDGFDVPTWVGLSNYETVLTDPDLLNTIFNALRLIFFFSLIPVTLGLVVASVIRRSATGSLGNLARTVLFLPQVIPLVAAGIVWSVVLSLSGIANQFLTAIGLEGITRAWLGDFDTALPAVGLIGAWVLLGLCTLLLLTGMTKIDPALYESARIDGAGAVQEFLAITLPSLRQEIGVCVTVTVILALRTFDIVYVTTGGGPGLATMVPGLDIYVLAFQARAVGVASALAVVLIVLILVIILPIQYLSREKGE